ncbi:MAG: hypothetical protein EBZ53_02560 [Verrucomicrobia bacterium]|nr:hypothetical protein [Verrucomicrobiota bacterium]
MNYSTNHPGLRIGILCGWAALSWASLPPAVGNYTAEGQRLVQGVQNLAENTKARGDEYKDVIRETIKFGSSPDAADRFYSSSRKDLPGAAQAEWNKFIQDSFSILDEGERRDPQDPDWPKLREELSKLRPPPGADSKPQPDKKNQKKDQNMDKKKEQKGSGKDKQQQPSGGGQKPDPSQGGEGKESEGESQGPPSQGQPGKGDKKGGQKDGDSEGSGGGEDRAQKQEGGGKDPNQIRDFSTNKEGEGQMKERGRNEEMKGMEDEKAGFGNFGQEKKEGKEPQGLAGGQAGEKEQRTEAPPGMRVVGGGSGQKVNDKTANPLTLESMARLDQVKQSDSPAILQQRLQPQDQRPQPSSLGKPW